MIQFGLNLSKDLLVNFASSKIDNFNHLSSENLLGVFLLVIFSF